MKRSIKNTMTSSMLVAGMLAGTISTVSAGPANLNIMIPPLINNNVKFYPKNFAPLVNALRPTCVDLAVFIQKRRVSDTAYRVTFGVRNVSTKNYVSREPQQAIVLARNGAAMDSESFSVLNAGQTLTWSQTVPRPFEFPDTYGALYSADPDIYADGNPRNDDCNSTNNSRQVEIH